MNFLSNAMAMAKVAAEKGVQLLQLHCLVLLA